MAYAHKRERGFTLVELLVVVAAVGLLATIVIVSYNFPKILNNMRYSATVNSLQNIAQAAQAYANDNDKWAPDVNRSIPSEFTKYINPGSWAKGPFPGSVYDWDNWQGQTCWDGSPGGIQVTLRQVTGYKNKTTANNYTIYYVIKGSGIPHCSDSTAHGECINCQSRYP